MNLEKYIFIATFIINVGLTAFSILLSYTLFKRFKKEYFQTLLFQQIFFYSYLLYGIWGNIVFHYGLDKLNLTMETYEKISFYFPILGMPFLIVSWFMLLKFIYQIKGYSIKWYYSVGYFIVLITLLITASHNIQTHQYGAYGTNEELIKKVIITLNLLLNVVLLLPLLLRFKANDFKAKKKEIALLFMVYNGIVLLYSTGLWVSPDLHYLFTIGTFLLISLSGMFLPLIVWKIVESTSINTTGVQLDFGAFCKKFEISKREAEIIQEICLGKSNKDIAETLFITLQTVKDHTHRIYTKTGIKNRVHLTNLVREIVK